MFNLADTLGTGYIPHVVTARAFRPVEDSLEELFTTTGTDGNTAVSVLIRDILRGETGAGQQLARDAGTAVSALQVFENAVNSVSADLTRMSELATNAVNWSVACSNEEKAKVQVEFNELANEINDLANNTDFNSYKLLKTDAEATAFFIGYDNTITVDSCDLSVTFSQVSLMNDPAAALSTVQAAINKTTAYSTHIESKIDEMEKTAATIEYNVIKALGSDAGVCNTDLANEIAIQVVEEALADVVLVLEIQANVSGNDALPLLRDWQGSSFSRFNNRA